MPLSGVVVNRMTELPSAGVPASGLTTDQATAAAADLELDQQDPAGSLAAALLRLYADRLANARTQTRSRDGFIARHPGVPIVSVPALSTDIHDLDGLRLIGNLLANPNDE